MGRKRKYFTEEERKAAQIEYHKRYYQSNKKKITEYQAEYHSTPKGRATTMVGSYKFWDNFIGRGECTLTAEWVIEHIFNQPCHYCGKTDWHELGCDRIDNTLPHTPDNVVPCCTDCNNKRGAMEYDDFMKKIGKIE